MGLTNLPGASNGISSQATLSAAATTTLKEDCHFDDYKQKVSAHVIAQCITCHSAGSGNLTLNFESSDTIKKSNYLALSQRVESIAKLASQTTLLRKITTGSGMSHSYQRSSSDALVIDFDDFAQNLLSDPTCRASAAAVGTGTGTGTGTSTNTTTCFDASCFF